MTSTNQQPARLGEVMQALRSALRDSPTVAAPPPPPACPTCKDRGYLVAAVPPGHPAFGQVIRCACRRRPLRPDLAQAVRDALGAGPPRTLATFDRERQMAPLLSWRGQAYPMHRQATALTHALALVQAFVAGPARPWLYLYGPCGSGKSHLAQAIYHALAPNSSAALLTAAGLLSYLRAGVEGATADARLVALQQLDLLIIDDLGTERPSSWGLARLYDLIEQRAAHRRPTVLTANVTLDELCPPDAPRDEQIRWDRLTSRIAQQLEAPLPLIVSDYRRIHWPEG